MFFKPILRIDVLIFCEIWIIGVPQKPIDYKSTLVQVPGNGFVPSDNKPVPEPIWPRPLDVSPQVTIGHDE